MQRPQFVELASLLVAGAVAMQLAVDLTIPLPPMWRQMAFVVSTSTGLGALVIAALEAAVVVAFWDGMNWARVTFIAYGEYACLAATSVPWIWKDSSSLAVLWLYKAAVAIFLFLTVGRKTVLPFFRKVSRTPPADQAARQR